MRISSSIGVFLRKFLSLFVICTIFASLAAPQTTYAANYASEIVRIAKGEVGNSNASAGYKYTSYARIASTAAWCAAFTSWCANQAGIPRNIIPAGGACDTMYQGVIDGGGYVTDSPQAGDLVFYKNYAGKFSHVGIMIDSTNSVQGNVTWGGVNPQVRQFPAKNMLESYPTMVYVHPNYDGNASGGNGSENTINPPNNPGRASKPTVSVDNNNSSVTVTWNSVDNADHYDVYLVQAPWGWEDIKYAASSWDTSYTFWNVRDGDYQTFVIARPNKDTIQSEWTSLSVKKAQKIPMEVVSSVSSVTIDSRDFSLQVGETKQLKAGVVGSGDISFDKIWSSSNSGVASVDSNGLVTAKSAGRATIKAESVSDRGKYDSVEVEVVASTPATEPTPTPTVYPGKTNRPSVSVNGSDVSVSWNAIENAQYYDVYFVEAPWGWNNLRYGQSTPGTSYTFKDVADGEYAAFVIAKPNDDSVQSPWQHFSVKTAPTPTANFYNINASNVSQTNAQLNASISYSGNRPYEVGVYFGDSPNSMWRVGSDAINHSKNPFDMWYSLNKYGVTLSPGTTYYYQMYAAFEDTEIKSNVASFTTPAAASYGNVVTARVSGTPGGLAINSQPNKNYKIGRMDEGVYCTIDLDRTSGNWYYVTYNGVSGYAYNRYLVIQ